MKKRIALVSILFIASFMLNAQNDFGIKGGLSYNSNGELKEFKNETESIIDNKGADKSGYNIGFYGKLDLSGFYLRPELVYTKTNSQYALNGRNEDYKMSKLDLPVLLGVKIIGPLDVFAGPAFQYILENDLNGLTFENIENNFSLGLNIVSEILDELIPLLTT